MRTRVKICGITNVQDALSAVAHGADAIGLVFYAPSPRNVEVLMAQQIVAHLPPFVACVGLFVNADASQITQVLSQVRLDLLQFHGDETAQMCEQFNMPYYKAIRVKAGINLLQCASEFSSAKALLLDTHSAIAVGGTGQTFDWHLIPSNMQKPLILAGGLTPENVGQAIKQVQPYAVDVSGGVELSKGIKDHSKIESFMHEVNQFRS